MYKAPDPKEEIQKGRVKLMEAILNEERKYSGRRFFSDVNLVNLSGESARGCVLSHQRLSLALFMSICSDKSGSSDGDKRMEANETLRKTLENLHNELITRAAKFGISEHDTFLVPNVKKLSSTFYYSGKLSSYESA